MPKFVTTRYIKSIQYKDMGSQNLKIITATQFNYGNLDSQQREQVRQATEEIKKRLRRAAQDIWEIGKMLSVVQSQLQRGQFDDWIKTEFDWSRRTAYKFISVYKRFDRQINFAEVNIATSALYLLAAESTPENIRQDFIDKAQQGVKITHQEVKQQLAALNEKKEQSSVNTLPKEATETADNKQQIITIFPKREIEKPLASIPNTVGTSFLKDKPRYYIEPGWHQIEGQHHLYYGDTALPDFADSIPYASLAIAITSDDWAHDWLIEKAKTVVVFPELEFETTKLTGLIAMFSASEDIVIFPWLPDDRMLEVTHQLGRKFYAGDMDYQKCQAAIAIANLAVM